MCSQSVAAHRLDEYLQATRITLAPDRIQLEIDLTPGIEIVPALRQTIDGDRDGRISDGEARLYASNVVGDMVVRHDDVAQQVRLERYRFPSPSELDEGIGTIRLEASVPAVSRGSHHLTFRNSHRADISVYLVNILMPSSNEIAIGDQRRDPLQRGIDIDFSLGGTSRSLMPFLLVMLALTAIALAVRRRPTQTDRS